MRSQDGKDDIVYSKLNAKWYVCFQSFIEQSLLDFCYQSSGLLRCKPQDDRQNTDEIGSHLFVL